MSSTSEEYRTLSTGIGLITRSHFDRLELTGSDVFTFLQALLTNDVAGLTPGQGRYSAYLTPQGRMIADLELQALEAKVVVEVAPGTAASLAARLDQLIFSEDVHVRDVSSSTTAIALVGGAAHAVVGEVLGVAARDLAALVEPDHIHWQGGIVSRAGDSVLPMFKVFSNERDDSRLAAEFRHAGAHDVSTDCAEAMRIEAGRTRFGVDTGADTIPLEAGLLDRAISTNKGCYVGQEIIIRMLHRGGGRVAKRFVIFAIVESENMPAAGSMLVSQGREVGRLTSIAPALAGAGFVGLGHLQRDFAAVNATVEVAGLSATVTGFAG